MTLQEFLDTNQINKRTFASMIDVEAMAVTRYVSGARFPRPEIIQRIIAATNGAVTANDFLPRHKEDAA